MKLIREPRKGYIRQLEIHFEEGVDERQSIREAIRMARCFSDTGPGCRVAFLLNGVRLEVTEFSNSDDIYHYYHLRRRLKPVAITSQCRA